MSARTLFIAALVLSGCSGEAPAPLAPPQADAAAVPDSAHADAPDAGIPAIVDASPDTARDASTAPSGCAGAVVCDSFESDTVGKSPAGFPILAANCSGTGTLAVDDQVAHGGTRSVKVTGQGGYCNHVFFGTDAPSKIAGTVWLRFWVRISSPLGAGHTTFLAMHDAHDGKDLRMGGQNAVLMWNRESDDATLPAMSPVGTGQSVAPAAGAWTCIEAAIDPARTLRTFVNGAEIAGLLVDGTPTPDVDAQWLANASWAPRLTDARFGWESYAGQAETLWFDDVAIGATRIGCGN